MAIELSFTARMEIEVALRDLNADFCYYLDHRDTNSLVGLFTDDAIYTHGERRSAGREAIKALFEVRNESGSRTARHMQTGLRLQIISENSAKGQSVCLTFAADATPPITPATAHLVADFIDRYERCADGRWRISQRRIERIFTDTQNEGPIGTR